MGKGPKTRSGSETRRKAGTLAIRCTESQLEAWSRQAAAEGLRLSEWVRGLLDASATGQASPKPRARHARRSESS